MKIIIHGTKGGYRSLYSTPGSPSITEDIRSATSNETTVGQSCYSIVFLENAYVFTKIVIVRDLIRSMATGNIAFSLYLTNRQKISGIDAKSILDKLSEHYCKNYAPEYNLGNIHEDWSFVDTIRNDFKVNNVSASDDVEDIQRGTSYAAFLYYSSDVELQKYFDAPYQEEYSRYKQTFLINSVLEGKPENPLNTLRHDSNANLTGKIDLENPKYRLLFNEHAKGGLRIEVKVNGAKRSNKNKIRKKDELEISYTKPYYIPESYAGRWTQIDAKYILLDDDKQTVTINAIDLQPIEKTISIEVKDYKGNPINDAEVQISTQPWMRISGHQHKIKFVGEELKEHWEILAKKNDSFYSEKVYVVPEKDGNSLDLILHKYNKLSITATAKLGGNLITNFKFRINDDKEWRHSIAEYTFKDEDIEKTWKIELSKREVGYEYLGVKEFCPAKEENSIYVELEKTESTNITEKPTSFKIDAGDCGRKTRDAPDYVNSRDKAKIEWIKPNKGYKVTRFNEVGSSLVAQYEKKKSFLANRKLLVILIAAAIIIGVAIWRLFPHINSWLDNRNSTENIIDPNTPEEIFIEKSKIEKYIVGDSLILETLEYYKSDWTRREQKIKKDSTGLPIDTIEYQKWKNFEQRIDSAIKLRTLVNDLNFDALKKWPYYDEHKELMKVFLTINPNQYTDVKSKLGVVSTLTLKEITDSISAVSEPVTSGSKTKEPAKKQKTNKVNSSNQSSGKNASISTGEPSKSNPQVTQPSDKINQIKEYLKGDKLKEEVLKSYLGDATITDELRKSIELALEFWELNGKSEYNKSKTYWSFREKVRKDPNFNGSKLMVFLDKVKNDANPSYARSDKETGLGGD